MVRETADSLRTYLDHILKSHLLFNEEKPYATNFLLEENLKKVSYVASVGLSPEFLLPSNDIENMDAAEEMLSDKGQASGGSEDLNQKRRLRSHKEDEVSKIEGAENVIVNRWNLIRLTLAFS